MNSNTIFFFDLDGVLTLGFSQNEDFRTEWEKFLLDTAGITMQKISSEFFNTKLFQEKILTGKTDLLKSLSDYLALNGYKGLVQPIIDFWFSNGTIINTELFDLVKVLKEENIPLYLATNQEKHRAKYIWEKLNFRHYFDKMYTSGELGVLKKERSFFRKVNTDLNLAQGATVVFFDDDEKNIISAKKEGWKSVLYRSLEDFLHQPSVESYKRKLS